MPADVRRRRELASGPGLKVAVCIFAPGERHPAHTDAHSRISLLLEGGFREDSRRGSIRMAPGHVLLKSRRARHADQFGEGGARLATIEFTADDPFDAVGERNLWRQRTDAFAMRHAAAFLEAAHAGDLPGARSAGVDLLAAGGEEPGARPAPRWLGRLRQELESSPLARVDVTARARDAGVHPAHASRLFRRCFSVSLTDFARAQGVRRALGLLARGSVALSDVALEAGFYDQSHMCRAFRRVMGRAPAACRSLFAATG
jgi:AraC family transcriptional regulator